MDNNKPDIKGINDGLQTKIMEVWDSVECKTFDVNPVYINGKIDLLSLCNDMKKSFSTEKNIIKTHKEIVGIYMIYMYDKNSTEENNNLFYVGESGSSIYSRLKRHFNKVEKQKLENSPRRYKTFSKLLDKDVTVRIKILRFNKDNDDLKYRRIIEEILTLSEKPTYIDNLNGQLEERKSIEQGEI